MTPQPKCSPPERSLLRTQGGWLHTVATRPVRRPPGWQLSRLWRVPSPAAIWGRLLNQPQRVCRSLTRQTSPSSQVLPLLWHGNFHRRVLPRLAFPIPHEIAFWGSLRLVDMRSVPRRHPHRCACAPGDRPKSRAQTSSNLVWVGQRPAVRPSRCTSSVGFSPREEASKTPSFG